MMDYLKTLLIDGDGVLYRRDEKIPGFDDLFAALQARGINWALVTNNATNHIRSYVKKLRALGIEAEEGQLFSSGSVTAQALAERYPTGTHIHVVGTADLCQALEEVGLRATRGPERPASQPEVVIASLDRDLTYDKLDTATRLIRAGATFIATNPDRTFPTPDGLAPGAGTIAAALEAATDVTPEFIGKPHPAIFEAAMAKYGADPSETAIIGDRLNTDIEGGISVGIGTILVLSGVTTEADLAASDIQPDVVFPSIAEFAAALNAL